MTDRKNPRGRTASVMTDTECDCWEIVKISRGLADAPASRVYVEIPWLQEAIHNIQRVIARAERERRDAA